MAKKLNNNTPYALSPEQAARTVGPGLSFEASEAYKLLRTNLAFSFPESGKSHFVNLPK